MASLPERVPSVSLSRRQAWKSTPRAMRICFYAAVFSLFASVSVLLLMMRTTYLSPFEILGNIVITGGFAIAYAAVWIGQRYWLVVVLLIAEGIVFSIVGAHYSRGSQLIAAGSPLRQQLEVLGIIGIVSVSLGYALFIVFFGSQGARYFRAHNEIAMAAEIHRALVPPIHQTIRSFEIYGISVPSGEVGGDLVDVAGDGQSWTGYVADVSGHGVSAGLLMAMFKTAVRTRVKDASTTELLAEVHRALYPLKTPNMFATVTVLGPRKPRVVIPTSALLMNNDRTSVFVETAPWTFERRAVCTWWPQRFTPQRGSTVSLWGAARARGTRDLSGSFCLWKTNCCGACGRQS